MHIPDREKCLSIFTGMFRALVSVHQQKIIHGAVTPVSLSQSVKTMKEETKKIKKNENEKNDNGKTGIVLFYFVFLLVLYV
jgi:hypothetical protein